MSSTQYLPINNQIQYISNQLSVFSRQKDNPFCKYLSEIDGLVKQLLPPNQSNGTHGPSTSLPRPQRKRHPILPPFDETMALGKVPRPLHSSLYNAWRDPVLRHGAQLQEVCNHTRKGKSKGFSRGKE